MKQREGVLKRRLVPRNLSEAEDCLHELGELTCYKFNHIETFAHYSVLFVSTVILYLCSAALTVDNDLSGVHLVYEVQVNLWL